MDDALSSRHGQAAIAVVCLALLPLGAAVWLLVSRVKDRLSLIGMSLFVSAYVFSLSMNDPRWWWISGYLRWIVMGSAIAGVCFSLARMRDLPWLPPAKTLRSSVDVSTILLLAFGASMKLYFEHVWTASARDYQEAPLALRFPIRGVRALVVNGGSSFLWNSHSRAPAQRFALDVSALEPGWERRAQGLYPADLNDYAVYGAQVVSPCSGVVVAARDIQPDHTPPQTDRNDTAGNYVMLHCSGRTVLLAHLKQGGVLAQAGDAIQQGEPVGLVGNSGNTSEPHLHIQAVEGELNSEGEMENAAPVPMLFGGRFLVRGDVVDG